MVKWKEGIDISSLSSSQVKHIPTQPGRQVGGTRVPCAVTHLGHCCDCSGEVGHLSKLVFCNGQTQFRPEVHIGKRGGGCSLYTGAVSCEGHLAGRGEFVGQGWRKDQ